MLRRVNCVESHAECFRRHGVEVRFEDFGPTAFVCFRLEVKFKSLKAVVMIDTVGEGIIARFAPTDKIHFVKIMQVGCYKASLSVQA